MTIVTRVREVKDVIHTVVEIANNRTSQNRATLDGDEVDAAGSAGRNGNRSVANNSYFVEFFKHHLKQDTTAAKDRRMSEDLTLNILALKVDNTFYHGSLKMKVRISVTKYFSRYSNPIVNFSQHFTHGSSA